VDGRESKNEGGETGTVVSGGEGNARWGKTPGRKKKGVVKGGEPKEHLTTKVQKKLKEL